MDSEETCEHELSSTNEHWMSDNTVMIELKCQKCGVIFEGLCIKK